MGIGREILIEKAIEAKYYKYTEEVIDLIKGLGDECRLSGDDSELKTVWQEWCYQLQFEEFFGYSIVEETIRGFCGGVLSKLPLDEIKILWAGRDPLYDEFEETSSFFEEATMKEHLLEELLRRVNNKAWGEDLGCLDMINN